MPRRPSEGLRLMVGGSAFERWYRAECDSDIFTPADAWQVTARNPDRSLVGFFREGQRVEMYVGEDLQLAGVVDDVRLHGTRQREQLDLVGRDLGAFLLDSEAKRITASKYTLLTLVQKLLDPGWGIRKVLTSFEHDRKLHLGKKDRRSKAGTSRRAPKFGDHSREHTQIDPGQRVAQILDERTRQLGFAWWLTARGDLFLGKPNYDQFAAYRFVCKRNSSNVLSWEVVRSMADRYSEITVVGQGSSGSGARGSLASSPKAAKFKATVRDQELVDRGIKRTLILSDCDVQSRAECQRRAESEMGHRRLQGLTIRVTVPDFRQGSRLFAIDTLADVEIPTANIQGQFYVTQRRFSEDRAGRRTQLTLHQPKVWLA